MVLHLMVVGCGAVVDRHYRGALRTLESRGIARVVALVDPDAARTSALEQDFPSARAFASPAEAFAQVTPHLTVVASPPSCHAEHAVAAFAAGSHVLCEKPMAASVDDAERMVAAARAAGRVLAVGMTRRMYTCLAGEYRFPFSPGHRGWRRAHRQGHARPGLPGCAVRRVQRRRLRGRRPR